MKVVVFLIKNFKRHFLLYIMIYSLIFYDREFAVDEFLNVAI